MSIATFGEESDLLLAKGPTGAFYVPSLSFSNLTMKPGEGYEMKIRANANAVLIYPSEDTDTVRKEEKGGEKPIAEPRHFRFVSRTGDFLPIVIGLEIADRRAENGDEIGVFAGDTLC